jgi:hypothetical protein
VYLNSYECLYLLTISSLLVSIASLLETSKRQPYLVIKCELLILLDYFPSEWLCVEYSISVMLAHVVEILGQADEFGASLGALIDQVLVLLEIPFCVKS